MLVLAAGFVHKGLTDSSDEVDALQLAAVSKQPSEGVKAVCSARLLSSASSLLLELLLRMACFLFVVALAVLSSRALDADPALAVSRVGPAVTVGVRSELTAAFE